MHIIRKTVRNMDEIIWDFTQLEQQFTDLAGTAVDRAADKVMHKARIQVPVETGLLKASGDKDVPFKAQGLTRSSFGFNTSYAVYVHEIPPPAYGGFLKGWGIGRIGPWVLKGLMPKTAYGDVQHISRSAMHKPPTKWKYLEDPVLFYIDEPLEQLVKLVDDLIISSSGRFMPPPKAGPTYAYGRFAGAYESYGETTSAAFKPVHGAPSSSYEGYGE